MGKKEELNPQEIFDKMTAHQKRMEEKQGSFFRRVEKAFTFCKESIREHELILKEIYRKQDEIDGTMGNVLLAIKQNEYLQAWYPEQHGFTAGNVVGIHPARLVKPKAPK